MTMLSVDILGELADRALHRRAPVDFEVLKKLALPGVPDFRTGPADVGDGEQVQRGQAFLTADHLRESDDDLRIRQVLLLGNR